MKYSEKIKGRRPKIGTGVYVTAAVCLMIVGGASWFALSNYRGAKQPTVDNASSAKEYSDISSSYIDSSSEKTESVAKEKNTNSENSSAEQTKSQKKTEASNAGEAVSATEKQIRVFTMPVQGEILKPYSDSVLQYSKTLGDMRLHTGIDIACDNGTSVSACSDGTVTSVELNGAFGNTVSIDHGDGITVKYSSLDGIKVKTGDNVSAGDIIGAVSSIPAECGDRDHLHLETVKDGIEASPLETLNLG